MKAQTESKVWPYSSFNLGIKWLWVVNATPRPLYPQEVPIAQSGGWAPGPAWTGAENLARTGMRSPVLPASSQSLYKPRYPGPQSAGDKITYVILM